MPKSPDPSLAKALQCPLLDGDTESWIRCCTARFLPLARRVAGSDDLARDALHDAWVYSIIRHEAARSARPRAREKPLDQADEPRRKLRCGWPRPR